MSSAGRSDSPALNPGSRGEAIDRWSLEFMVSGSGRCPRREDREFERPKCSSRVRRRIGRGQSDPTARS
ncbi:MAG: hypothetical protein CMJ51_06980 [Planctomycetaceae bacterium]|nr:hypothetical protein [Planctomycetaceae bacterium]